MASSAIFHRIWEIMFPPSTLLTTVDENKDLEAYIYIPTERASPGPRGFAVEFWTTTEQLIEHTAVNFVSPQVDDQLQGILAKAPVRSEQARVRTAQLVKARVIWKRLPRLWCRYWL